MNSILRMNWSAMFRSSEAIYFHPVARENSNDYLQLDTFKCLTDLEIKDTSERNTCVLKYEYVIGNESLIKLINSKKANVYLEAYCGETLFSKIYLLEAGRSSIEFPAGAINGRVEIQLFIIFVAEESTLKFTGINPEFGTDSFLIEKSSPLAVSETFAYNVFNEYQSFRDLIRIQTSEALDPNEYQIVLQSSVITINMGINVRKSYEKLKSLSSEKANLFASIYKDTFVEALMNIDSEDSAEFLWAEKLKSILESMNVSLKDLKDFQYANRVALLILGKKSYEKLASHE